MRHPAQSTRSLNLATANLVAVLLTITGLVLIGLVPTSANAHSRARTIHDHFIRRGADEVSPSGHSVLTDCQSPSGTGSETWPDAEAILRIRQVHGRSHVTIRVTDAKPRTYYTVWLRLGGTDSNGNPFGGNPVTGGQATAMAATDDLPRLLASSGPGNGDTDQPNGFTTDRRGHAVLRTTLDFPIVGGAYPWHRWEAFDPDDPQIPGTAAPPAVHPVAIAGPQGPYTLRIVSHCTDGVGHGLTSGDREWWFDWTVPE